MYQKFEQPRVIPGDLVFERITLKYLVELINPTDQTLKPLGRVALMIGSNGHVDKTGDYRLKILHEPTAQLKSVPLFLDRRDHPMIGMLVGHTLMLQGVISIKRNPEDFTPTSGIFRLYNTEVLNKIIISLGLNKPS